MGTQTFDLDQELIRFTGHDGATPYSIRDAVEGVIVFGSNGSGKSSGSLKTFCSRYLSAGMGGLILTVKGDEKEVIMDYLRQTNRMDDLILVEPGGEHHFNFLEYEAAQQTGGKAISENLAEVIETVIASNDEQSKGNSNDPFWQDSLHQLIVNVLDLSLLAYGKVSVQGLYDMVLTIPKKGQKEEGSAKTNTFTHAFNKARTKIEEQGREFASGLSDAEKQKLKDGDYFDDLIVKNIPDASLFRSVDQFFNGHYKGLSEKTRSIIDFSFIGFLSHLLREPIYSLFCRDTSTFSPDDCLNGKVIILNVPTKLYHKAGRTMQVAFKYIYQRAMERRKVADNARPVFLICDEAQELLHEHDVSYQATARSSRICTLYATQNLSSLYANMGGDKSEHRVNAFLGTLGTKIFHSNSDVQTNNYASALIGSAYTEDHSRSTTLAEKFSSTRNMSYKLESMMRPEEFTNLKTGGGMNDYMVEGVVHRQGRRFHDGLSFRKINFKQV